MNKKHQKTLKAIFANPISATIVWADVEKLLVAIGAKLSEGEGSRVKFVSGQEMLVIHRPHPGKEAKRYQIKVTREFLQAIGVNGNE